MGFNIPFAFMAGKQTMPAGEYATTFDGFHRLVLQCRFASCSTAVPIAFDTNKPARANAEKGILRFEQYGDLYVLRAVRRPLSRDWKELFISKQAVEAAKANPNRQVATISAH